MKNLNKNIALSSTISSEFYFDDKIWEEMKEKIFSCSWQYIGDEKEIFNTVTNIYPFSFLDNYISEPLLLTKQNDQIRCMSNVCTHRAFLLAHHPSKHNKLVCAYHGRRFDLEGQFEYMPEFKEVENFPRDCEHLQRLELKKWSRFLFTSLSNGIDWNALSKQLNERLGFMDIDAFIFAPQYSKTYNVQCHWALYIDNYLEGFHIPFVHPTLNSIIDYGKYETLCQDHSVLQIGYGDDNAHCFEFPKNHIDYGQKISAYYYWLFPNFMLNFYPWGVQLNIVKPISPNFTKVEFVYYIRDQELFERIKGSHIGEKTQQEDEWVVEGVQKGMKSRFYKEGRFSAKREKGVHYFHQLLQKYLQS